MPHFVKITLCLFGLLALTGCNPLSVRTQIEIDATPGEVFAVLSDFTNYASWNPTYRHIEGPLIPDAPLTLYMLDEDGTEKTMTPFVTAVEPDRLIRWGSGIPGILHRDHSYRLVPMAGNKTRLHNDEDLDGFMLLFSDLSLSRLTEDSIKENKALKRFIEDQRLRP